MWAVGVVYHNQEMKCLNKLKELDIDAFVPIGRRLTKPGKRKKRSPVVTTYKLFPGYIFVHLPDGFEFMKLKNIRIRFLQTKDKEGEAHIASVPLNSIVQLREKENDLADLFVDYDKKFIRDTYKTNQLVCWKNNNHYMLGFVSRNTQGKPFAYVKLAFGKELKISVSNLALL